MALTTLTAGARLAQYEIIGPLGAGGMGEVYRAHDARLDRDVAIKVLSRHLADDPEMRERFEHEAARWPPCRIRAFWRFTSSPSSTACRSP